MKKSIFTIAITALLVGLAACTAKKRDNALPYGEDKDLFEISKVDGQEFDVTTTKEVSVSASNKSDVQIKDETKEKTFLNYVEYKTEAKLLAESPFRGQAGSTYKVRYVLEGNALKVYKLKMKDDDLSFEERQSAETLKDGKLGAAVVSYNVSYFSMDNTRNDLDEATHKLRLVAEQSKDKATHMKIDLNSKTLASFLQKDIVFPSNYFDGDWYFATTIVRQNYQMKENDIQSSLEWMLREESAKVRLKKEEGKLAFYGLRVDGLIKSDLDKREENQSVFLEFPAEFMEYRMADQGQGKSVKEEEYKQNTWNKRPFVKLDLKNTTLGEAGKLNGEVRDVQVSFDPKTGRKYFSFSILNTTTKSIIRYALLQATARKDAGKYEKKTYFREDQSVFGFFSTNLNLLDTRDRTNEEMTQNATLVNRFNPNLEKIVFHPSDQTPDWTVDLIRNATESWAKAFELAGVSAKVEFNPEKVKVGDIRYNLVHILSDEDGNNVWGGFGPSVADTESGEIISATSNINLANYLQAGRLYVRRYIRSNLEDNTIDYIKIKISEAVQNISSATSAMLKGTTADQAVKAKPAQSLFANLEVAFLPSLPNEKSENIQLAKQSLVISKAAAKGYEWQNNAAANSKQKSASSNFNKRNLESNGFGLTYPNLTHEIETLAECADVRNYVASAKNGSRKSHSEENELVEGCSRAVLKQHLVRVIMHEMGHNFGLRHNFYGSTDKANFHANSKESFSSSVMEYPTMDQSIVVRDGKNSMAGWYDVAAIRWGYTGKLFSKDMKSALASNEKKPLKAQTEFKDSRPFKYCTDENATGSSAMYAFDALCSRSDEGSTATEAALGYIKAYNYSISNSLKLESGDLQTASAGETRSMERAVNFMLPLMTIYHQYRMMIEDVSHNLGYLEGETVQTYPNFLKQVEAKYAGNEAKLAEFKDYQKAAGLAYNFMKAVAFMPDYYCAGRFEKDPLASLKFVPFSEVQREIFESTKETVQSCANSKVAENFKSKNGDYMFEVGYPMNPLLRDLELRNDRETPVALGTKYDRAHALTLMSARISLLRRNTQANFYPNFFDEPQYRKDLEQSIISRLTDGVSTKSLGNAVLNDPRVAEVKLPKFANEADILGFMYETLMRGSLIPGKSVANSDRMSRFMINYAYSNEQLRQPGVKSFFYAGRSFFATPENEVVYQLIDKAQFSVSLKKSSAPADSIIVATRAFLSSRLPSHGDKAFTLSQLLKIFNDLKSGEGANTAGIAAFAQLVMQEEIEMLNSVVQPYVDEQMKDIESDEAKKKKFDEILATSLIQIMGEKLSKNLLTKETLDDRLKAKLAIFQKQVQLYKTYQSDFDAQSDLLVRAVIGGSGM